MFGALLAQEFRFTLRSLLQILLWSAAVCIASAVMVATGLPVISHIGQFFLNMVIVGISIATLIVMTVHYWRSMHGSQAPFTHSIPVSGRMLFTAKVVYYLLAVGLSAIPTILAGLLLVSAQTIGQGGSLSATYAALWEGLVNLLSTLGTSRFILSMAMMVLASAASVIQLLGAITIGFSGRYPTRGYVGPVLSLAAFYMVNQIVAVVGMLFIPISLAIVNDTPTGIEYSMMLPDLINAVQSGGEPNLVGIGGPLATIPLGIIAGWWAIRSLEKHLYVR